MVHRNLILGPWGSNTGEPWDDGSFTGVREIIVEHGDCILSIAVVYHKEGTSFEAEKHGGGYSESIKSSKTKKIKLDYPSEFLVGVSGHWSPLKARNDGVPCIRSLTFRSNRRRTLGPFGVEEGEPFDLSYEPVKIVGFHGRSSWHLESIGVRYHPELIDVLVTKTSVQAPKDPEGKDHSALVKYGKDLTELAKARKLDPVIGRDDEISRCIRILSKRLKNNPVLIGEPGVGKTAISEGIAQRIVEGDVPEVLMNRRIISLDVGAVVAGTELQGTFEERLKQVLKEVTESYGQIMLFIDEIHLLVGAGATSKSAMDAANLLKPVLGRGELQCIGATTFHEYRKYIEKDAALERRFQQVYVAQPTVENTISILRGLRERYELHHGVRISDGALKEAATLSDQYITGRLLPDKAIDLVDEAAASLKVIITSKPTAIHEIEELIKSEKEKLSRENEKDSASLKISALEKKKDELTKQWNHGKSLITRINEIKKLIQKIRKDGMIHQIQQAKPHNRPMNAAPLEDIILFSLEHHLLKSAEEQLTEHRNSSSVMLEDEVEGNDIAVIVSKWTGIPVSKLQQSEKEKLLHLEEELHKRVVGQDLAVKAVAEAIRRARAGLADRHQPIASFMFMGPTGVGKTELAKALASCLFNTEAALVRFDMCAYKERHAVSRLIGSPPGYKQHEEGGQLTETIRRRPYAVILFDEIEKAHSDVLDILLPILDDGRLTDTVGRTVDFTSTVVIMTSNVGSQEILKADDKDVPNELPYKTIKQRILDAARAIFRLEFMNQVDDKDVPNELPYETIKQRVMDAAGTVFRPEFMNRVDECIVFQPLSRDQIIGIVKLQLDRVGKIITDRQKMKIQVTDDAIQLLASLGYDPKYGARPVKRVIKQNVENELANSYLREEFKDGDTILIETKLTTSSKKELSFKRHEASSVSTTQHVPMPSS